MDYLMIIYQLKKSCSTELDLMSIKINWKGREENSLTYFKIITVLIFA
jgi:hypothetical protein